MDEFVEVLRTSLPPLRVEKTSISYGAATGEFKTFRIITGNQTEEIVEGSGTGAAYFEVMFSKQDQALSRLDQLLTKQDQMLEKQDELLAEVKGVRNDLRIFIEGRIAKMEETVKLRSD
ncbi:MAG: hypothetical protein QXV62_06150 [Nitrososphaerota archaeon]